MTERKVHRSKGKEDPVNRALAVPEHVHRDVEEQEASGWSVVETYFGKDAATGQVDPGLGADGFVLGSLERYVKVPKDPNTGEPLIEGRFCTTRRDANRVRNVSAGFQPLRTNKRGELDPNGERVAPVGGMELMVRPRALGKERQKKKDARAIEYANKARAENEAADLSRRFGIRTTGSEEIEKL